MTARVFASLPRILTRTFRETAPAVWHRHRVEFQRHRMIWSTINASSDVADADGISMRFGVPVASCAMADCSQAGAGKIRESERDLPHRRRG